MLYTFIISCRYADMIERGIVSPFVAGTNLQSWQMHMGHKEIYHLIDCNIPIEV